MTILIALAWATTADIPVQGILETGGAPLNGTFPLRLRLYADADGLTVLHTTNASVQFASGGFAANLTSVPHTVLRDNPTLYLGVQRGTDPEARTPLGWAPRAAFAALAGDAAKLGGIAADSYALDADVTAAITSASASQDAALVAAQSAWNTDLSDATATLQGQLSTLASDLSAAQTALSSSIDGLTTSLSNYYTRAEVDTAIANVTVDAYTRAEVDALLTTGSPTATTLAQRVVNRAHRQSGRLEYVDWSVVRGSGVPFYSTGGPVEFISSIVLNGGSHTGCRFLVDGVPAEVFSIGDTGHRWESGLEYTTDGWQTWDASRVYTTIPPGYHVVTSECFNDSSASQTTVGDGDMTHAFAVVPYDAAGEVKAYTATVTGAVSIATGSGWVAMPGLSLTVPGQGGPFRVSYQIPMTNGSHSTCRTLVDGTPAGAAEGDDTSYIWQEGLTITNDGWAMWSRNRMFTNLSAGNHTISVQCRTDGGTVTIGDTTMTQMMNVFTYPSAANAQKVKVSMDNHVGYLSAVPNGTWTTQAGLSTTFTSNGGPVQIAMSIPLSGGSSSACRPIVDGATLSVGEPDNFGSRWHNGLVYTADGWAMWERTRVYRNIPAGTHTLAVQCIGDSGSYSAGHPQMASNLHAIAYDL